MPSAQAKLRRKLNRAVLPRNATAAASGGSLDDDVERFNNDQRALSTRRRELQERIARRETSRNLQQLERAAMAPQSRPTGATATASPSQGGALSTESHRQANIEADRSSKGGQKNTESRRQQASNAVREKNPLTLLQSTYPERIAAASSVAVQELLEMLNMYEPPSEPEARNEFEQQVYTKVKRILKNQKQRAYRKAKKQGVLQHTHVPDFNA
jgi:hypothetical protein